MAPWTKTLSSRAKIGINKKNKSHDNVAHSIALLRNNDNVMHKSVAIRGGGDPLFASSNNSNSFDSTPFTSSTLTFIVVNIIGFLLSFITRSQVHVDLIGTGVFGIVALQMFLQRSTTKTNTLPSFEKLNENHTTWSATLVMIWSFKLASFLFYRALTKGHDARLEDTLSTTSGMMGFWIVSFIWNFLTSLSLTLGATSSSGGGGRRLLGSFIYFLGLAMETGADLQKWQFKTTNPGQFCNVGLWSISQHPNFVGNLFIWTGIFILNAPALIEPITTTTTTSSKAKSWLILCGKYIWSWRRVFLAFLSPLFLYTLFSGQANGSITNAVQLAQERYGKDPAYQEYIATTPKLFPTLKSITRTIFSKE